ncbi:MAG: DNA (cytosine-5-)-methyltransferase [Clostridia bacterium]|nr:DNA (cytosine-5-)-methyltransferase [Clostridia bacterium]
MIELDKIYKNSLKGKKFIDLFCGLGGFRLALESYGAECVFSSDIDKHVSKTYENNFGDYPLSDITKVNEVDIPKHDILCAGFPCQAFSISGKQKGFEDTRGTLFREVVRIAKYHKPELLLLENVKNLEKHDNGKTFKVIKENIENIGYNMYYQVINASKYGVPQSRERIYMVCIKKDLDNNNYKFPKPINKEKCVKDVLINNGDEKKYVINKPYSLIQTDKQVNMFKVYNKPVRIGTVNKGGQGDRIYDPMGQAITLSAEGGGTGSKTGLYYINNEVRKLHPRECARLMGYPENYILDESVNQAQKQFGNSVVVDVLQYVVKSIIDEGSIKNG